MHPVWNLLFHNPEFWDQMTKQQYCDLRSVCKEARESIPDREAIACIFRRVMVRKTDLFRLLPLTVHNVMKLRSPVNFVEAFRIAEEKAGGFRNCMAIVRERGLMCRRQKERRLADFRDAVLHSLRIQGVSHPPLEDPAFQDALQNGCLLPVAVWRFTCAHDRFRPCEESNAVRDQLIRVRNRWIKNIHLYVNMATNFLNDLRLRSAVGEFHHVMFTHGVLMVGVITVTRSSCSKPRCTK